MKLLLITLSLFSFQVWSQNCGLQGSVQERLSNCHSSNQGTALVLRKGNTKVLLDKYTNKLWTAPFAKSQTFYGGIEKCAGIRAIKNYKWKMSQTQELYEAYEHGIFQQLSKPRKTYWGKPGGKFRRHDAYLFEVYDYKAHWAPGDISYELDNGGRHYVKNQILCVGIPQS